MNKISWFRIAEFVIVLLTIYFLALTLEGQNSPYGTPFGPHAIVYSGTPTSGPHWSPVDYFNGGEYQGPPIGYTNPFDFTIACSNYWDRNGKPAYFNRYMDAVLPILNKPLPGATIPCPDVSGRAGCLYPQAFWSWPYKEPEAQSAFLVVTNQVASDPDWKMKCTETRDQWVSELLQGVIPYPGWVPPPPYTGGNVCPSSPPPPTALPTHTPTGGVSSTLTPTQTPTQALTQTPTRTPSLTPSQNCPTATVTRTPTVKVICSTVTPVGRVVITRAPISLLEARNQVLEIATPIPTHVPNDKSNAGKGCGMAMLGFFAFVLIASLGSVAGIFMRNGRF